MVYHGTAQSALDTLFRQYGQTGQRVFTLTGAYGSGKSTVALLMAGLLHPESTIHKTAIQSINEQTKALFVENTFYKKGWLQIRSVGG
ncbi:ATP-binding protein, partial [Vibrio anguillarum]|nr:ATP-binding protein [Vibrio anguillarum]